MGDARAALQRLLGVPVPAAFSIVARTPLPPRPGTRLWQVTLATPTQADVRAFLSMPEKCDGPVPAILHLHAHGNRYDIGAAELIDGRPALQAPSYAQTYAQAGLAALCVDLPCFGSRRHVSESALSKTMSWHGATLFGAMLAEARAMRVLLQALPEIDGARIGACGLSMGATLAFWLGACDCEIRAVAHLCCFADLATLVTTGAHDLHGHYMTVPGLLRHFSTGQIAGLIAPRPQLVCAGLADPLTPEQAVMTGLAALRDAYAAAQAPSRLETLIDPASGHVETPAMRAAVLDFFRRTLVEDAAVAI